MMNYLKQNELERDKMKKVFILLIILWVIITSQVACVHNKPITYKLHSKELYDNLIELNDVSKKMQEIIKANRSWRDTSTILLVNELIIEITNLLLIDKLSTISLSVIKDEYIEIYFEKEKTKLEFIRETIKKNHKGIRILSNTASIKKNKSVVSQINKVNEIIESSIALLDKDINNLHKEI